LWFDSDPKRDLAEKVARAADRYRFKFGRRPNLCYVNPSMLGNGSAARLGRRARRQTNGRTREITEVGSLEFNGVRLVPADNVLKYHLWIGVEEGTELRKAA
jgi:hypothetical protein